MDEAAPEGRLTYVADSSRFRLVQVRASDRRRPTTATSPEMPTARNRKTRKPVHIRRSWVSAHSGADAARATVSSQTRISSLDAEASTLTGAASV